MYQDRSDLETFTRHRPEMVAGYRENLHRFQGNHISWRSHHPRIRQHTANITLAPLNGLARPGATIDEQSRSAGKKDVKGLHLAALCTQHFSSIQLSNGPVCYEPLQLRPGRWAQGFMFRQPIDEISCYHRRALSRSEAELFPNNISDGKCGGDFAMGMTGNGYGLSVSPEPTSLAS